MDCNANSFCILDGQNFANGEAKAFDSNVKVKILMYEGHLISNQPTLLPIMIDRYFFLYGINL